VRTGTDLKHNYKLSSTCGLCKEVILYRSDLCNKVAGHKICLSHLWNLIIMRSLYRRGLCIEVVFGRRSLIKGFTLIYKYIKI